jgi:hypothetical protein
VNELARLVDAIEQVRPRFRELIADLEPFETRLDELLARAEAGSLPEPALLALLRAHIASEPRLFELLLVLEPSVPVEYPGAVRAEPPAPPLEPAEEEPPRFVNVAVLRSEDFVRLPASRPLARSGRYQLRIDIGPLSPESVVKNAADNPVPVDLLPPTNTGHWLEVAVASPSFEVPDRRLPLFLPRSGSSFTCLCEPWRAHRCREEDRSPYVLVPVTAPARTGPAMLRVALYYDNNVVQSQLLTADVAESEEAHGEHGSLIDYTLTSELRGLEALTPRTLSVVSNQAGEGTHTLLINGGDDDGRVLAFYLAEGQLTEAMDRVRDTLLDVHVERVGDERRNRLDERNGKSRHDFAGDLSALAQMGWMYWDALFVQAGDPLVELLAGPKATVQVARVPNSTFVFPWAVIYDIPLDADPARHRLCRLVEEWDARKAMFDGAPDGCPYAGAHARNTLCPFGFWGYRHAIEQPPSTAGRALCKAVVVGGSADAIVARSLELDEAATEEHVAALAKALDFAVLRCSTLDDLELALADPELELLYFYCHGRRKKGPAGAPVPYLEVGQAEELPPQQIATWYRDWMEADRNHWRTTSPLVFINGCRTSELTTQTPVNFVDNFARVGAAGVIGTEITLSQRLASEAAEVFFGRFAGPARETVADALRFMRLHLLAKGNLLGLVYTAYCSAELQLVR